ncbi:MAG TPA: N-acetylmuramidase domain-containing protein [Bryobacteraceae bacterium]|nr:N-acetylmuramidase domain-containing protein [Bryobacteraceae bacterium]
MMITFTGSSTALGDDGLTQAAKRLQVTKADVWTVFSVETAGCGFLASRKPPILFERHVFSRLTGGKFDDGDISAPKPGGYGPLGEAQYGRLEKAMALDYEAALRSCSWGLGQIMGSNHTMVGFAEIHPMVAAMCESEDAQLFAFAEFLKSARLDAALRGHNWAAFARGYNGPDFARNGYDVKLAAASDRFAQTGLPNLTVRAAQLYLTFAGFDPGPIDGTAGPKTKLALQTFQIQHGLAQTGLPDPATMQALHPVPMPG